jgi:predicted dinucleotide-binding enzyme
MKTKIGILGSGIVAQTLGAGFLAHGYEVMLGTRDTSKLAGWQAGAGKDAKTGSFA